MNTEKLYDAKAHCPHCGHSLHLDIDVSEEPQHFTEECAACGDLFYLHLYRSVGDDKLHLQVSAEDEQIY